MVYVNGNLSLKSTHVTNTMIVVRADWGWSPKNNKEYSSLFQKWEAFLTKNWIGSGNFSLATLLVFYCKVWKTSWQKLNALLQLLMHKINIKSKLTFLLRNDIRYCICVHTNIFLKREVRWNTRKLMKK